MWLWAEGREKKKFSTRGEERGLKANKLSIKRVRLFSFFCLKQTSSKRTTLRFHQRSFLLARSARSHMHHPLCITELLLLCRIQNINSIRIRRVCFLSRHPELGFRASRTSAHNLSYPKLDALNVCLSFSNISSEKNFIVLSESLRRFSLILKLSSDALDCVTRQLGKSCRCNHRMKDIIIINMKRFFREAQVLACSTHITILVASTLRIKSL